MPVSPSDFSSVYKVTMPKELSELVDYLDELATPCVLELENREEVIEIQYLNALHDQTKSDIALKVFCFAVSYDGWPLVVDVADPTFPVLQYEFGDVDYLGISIKDILGSKVVDS